MTPLQVTGLRYQARAYKVLSEDFARLGATPRYEPWFTYYDPNRKSIRYCQPDAVFILPSQVVVVEIKLNYTSSRKRKLLELYEPVVAQAFGLPTVALLVTRNVRSWPYDVCFSASEALVPTQAPFRMVLIP